MKEHTGTVASVLLWNENGEVLLVRTHKHPNYWQPVGGMVEPGEGPLRAALRELEEECSLRLEPEDLSLGLVANGQIDARRVFLFTAHVASTESMVLNLKELIECKWFDIKDAVDQNVFNATGRLLLQRLSEESLQS